MLKKDEIIARPDYGRGQSIIGEAHGASKTKGRIMTQDEIDAAIAQRAATLPKTTHSTELHLRRIALEALRLQREGWRPEPKVTPEMERAIEIFRAAHAAWDDILNEGPKAKINSGAGVIAASIAQALTDARVKVPEDVRRWLRSSLFTSHGPTASTQKFIGTLIAAEDAK